MKGKQVHDLNLSYPFHDIFGKNLFRLKQAVTTDAKEKKNIGLHFNNASLCPDHCNSLKEVDRVLHLPVCSFYFLPFIYRHDGLAHLSYASSPPKERRLVVTGNSVRIEDENTESSAWFFHVLGVKHNHMGPRLTVYQTTKF